MKVVIWGSCVTRDAFDLGGEHDATISYHARSTWVSQSCGTPETPPVPYEAQEGFAHRMVQEDFGKRIIERAVEAEPDVVVFDLIDERFDVALVDEAWYTVNDYVERLGLDEALRAAAGRIVAFREPEREELFALAASVLAPRWLEALPRTRFVLHQAWYTARSSEPETTFYPGADGHVGRANRRLAAHYAELRRAFGDRLHVVEGNLSRHLLADPTHRWGLAHFHYVPEYYEGILSGIRAVFHGPLETGSRPPLSVPGAADSGELVPPAIAPPARRFASLIRRIRRRAGRALR